MGQKKGIQSNASNRTGAVDTPLSTGGGERSSGQRCSRRSPNACFSHDDSHDHSAASGCPTNGSPTLVGTRRELLCRRSAITFRQRPPIELHHQHTFVGQAAAANPIDRSIHHHTSAAGGCRPAIKAPAPAGLVWAGKYRRRAKSARCLQRMGRAALLLVRPCGGSNRMQLNGTQERRRRPAAAVVFSSSLLILVCCVRGAAAGGTASSSTGTPSSSSVRRGKVAANAFDSDPESFWQGSSPAAGSWLQVDFARPVTASQYEIRCVSRRRVVELAGAADQRITISARAAPRAGSRRAWLLALLLAQSFLLR